jgi:hypothetical protein
MKLRINQLLLLYKIINTVAAILRTFPTVMVEYMIKSHYPNLLGYSFQTVRQLNQFIC